MSDSPEQEPNPSQTDLQPFPVAYEEPEVERPATAAPTEDLLETETPVSERLTHDPYAALRFRDYQLYALGGFIATVASQMQTVAVGYELFERTGEALVLGLVGLVQAIPVILLALPAGHIADRFNRRKVVMLGLVFVALQSFGLALASHSNKAPVGVYYALLMMGATALAASGPARSAMLAQLVPDEVLSNAVTWNSSRWQIASVIGPAIGGAILAASKSPYVIYIIDGIGSIVLFVFMAQIRGRPQVRSREPASWSNVVAGVHFVKSNPLILATITLDMVAVLFGGAVALLPVYAAKELHTGAAGLGLLSAAEAVGALAMALTLAKLPPMRHAGRALLWAVAGFGGAIIVFGFSKNYWLSFAMLALAGACDNISVVVRHTLVQVLTPDSMRGRVSAVNNVFISASNELGRFESGAAAHKFGHIAAVVGGGIITILVVLAVDRVWPQVQELGSLQHAHLTRERDEAEEAVT